MKRSWLLCVLAVLLLTACAETELPGEQGGATDQPAATVSESVETTPVVLHPVTEPSSIERTLRRSESPGDASGFVLVTDVIPDVILEIRYYSTYNFIGDRIDGYEEPCALLTWEAAQALQAVSRDLEEKGYRLKIFDAYRPQSAVDHFILWAQDPQDTRMQPYFYPDLEKDRLFAEGYIATRSGHSRGSTVDLTLFDMAAGREADMGGPYDFFGERSHGNYGELTPEQKENRRLLRQTMEAHGFRSLSTEWWHFTLEEEPYPDLYFTFPVCRDSVLPDA